MNQFNDKDVSCQDVWREITSYIDGDTPPLLRSFMDRHFEACPRCKSVLDGARNVAQLLSGNQDAIEIPTGVSRRLYSKLEEHIAAQPAPDPRCIAVGITTDRVPLGSHLIYFWDGDEEFERGVGFLYPGLGKGEHCILFGHDEALERALQVIRKAGFDPEALIRSLDLTVIHRRANAEQTVSEIAAVLDAATRAGASAIRFLGNLGMGRDPLPAGEDDVLELERKVDAMISALPCVVVCMYDVRTVSGRLIVQGGLQTHSLAASASGVHQNQYHAPDHGLASSRHIH